MSLLLLLCLPLPVTVASHPPVRRQRKPETGRGRRGEKELEEGAEYWRKEMEAGGRKQEARYWRKAKRKKTAGCWEECKAGGRSLKLV